MESGEIRDRINQSWKIWSKLAPEYFEKLLSNIKNETKISPFKIKLQKWIRDTTSIHRNI